ncbi:ABC transporter permease [Desmospora profundinema]|uniref:ABC transport system permease protein n=1 Tax=Desmospora profundinema TaxID=1571184 RepID=A0ABU1IMG5_9BACL|nr:ABC transporter permease [Desmospora profundinema]MDR6225979.1 putative ABC transport system permease protein [Desmospora profundinema]
MIHPHYIKQELTNRFKRTLIAVLSVAIGVALFVSLQSYSEGYHQASRAPLTEIGADIVAQREGKVPKDFVGIVFPHSTAPLRSEEIQSIQRIPGVEKTTEALFFWSFEGDQRFLVTLGIDPVTNIGPARLKTAVREGRFLREDDKKHAVVDTSYASQNQLDVGDSILVNQESFEVVGLVDTSRVGQVANANVYIPIEEAQQMTREAPNVINLYEVEPDITNLLFVKANPQDAPQVSSEIDQLLGKHALVTTPDSFEEILGATFQLVDRFGVLVGLAGLFIALASLLRTVSSNIWERRQEIGLMRSIGWKRREITIQLYTETMVLTCLGWMVGIFLAWVISWGLGTQEVTVPVPWELSPTPHFLGDGAEEMAITVPMEANISPSITLLALVLCVAGGSIASLLLARRISNIKPAEVLKSE